MKERAETEVRRQLEADVDRTDIGLSRMRYKILCIVSSMGRRHQKLTMFIASIDQGKVVRIAMKILMKMIL